jgi:hypothetical protein
VDHNHFDELARTVVHETGNRRAIFRFLTGSALGGVAARLGLAEDADAKANKHKAKQKRTSGRDRQAQGQLQSEGKRKGKKRKKPVLKPLCAFSDCDDRGGTCCPVQSCAAAGACCPGQKKCPGYDECFAAEDCCPNAVPPLCEACDKVVCQNGGLVCKPRADWKPCSDGSCVPNDTCCPDAIPPLCNDCQDEVCDGGELVCQPNTAVTCQSPSGQGRCCEGACCGPDEQCCQGQCTSCPSGGGCGASGTCGCAGELSVSCPPRPERPNGYCCQPDHYGVPFWGCQGRVLPDLPQLWGCLYGDHYYP